MDAPQPHTEKVDLNEVLNQVEEATRMTFKDNEGNSYSSVFTKDLRKWSVAIHEATKDLQGSGVAEKALLAAKDDITQLMKDSEKKDFKIRELKDLVANAEKAAENQRKERKKEIAKANEEVIFLQSQLTDAELSKAATAKALKDAEASLKSPEAKFIPEEAQALHEEVKNLRSELLTANDMIAQAKVGLRKANVDLDILRKEAASKDALVIEAKTQLSTFKKQIEAAKVAGVSEIDLNDIDHDRLLVAFGSKGVEKLKAVLDIPSFDVRGRVQKLMGFFATISKTVSKTFGAMSKVLEHALDILKARTTTWTAILLPWVNGLVKDMVFMKLKSAKEYRLELERITTSVKARLPSAPLKEKLQAGKKAATGNSWKEDAMEARKKATKATNSLAKAISRLRRRCVSYLRNYARRAADSVRSAYHKSKQFVKVTGSVITATAKIGWVFFKTAFSNAEEKDPFEDRNKFVEEAMEYDLDSQQWVETAPPQEAQDQPESQKDSVWS